MMKRPMLAALACLLPLCTATAQPLDAPAIKAGDSWTYRVVLEKGTTGNLAETRQEVKVTRVTASSIFYSIKSSASPVPHDLFSGLDWGRVRTINGKEIPVNKPLSFPLAPGKTWELAYDEEKPGGNYLSQHIENKFVVIGYETVEVPAGKFQALKIEAEGRWIAEVAPTTISKSVSQTDVTGSTANNSSTRNTLARTTSGRIYKAYWYAPDIKRWVKSVEENYSSGGRRSERFVTELESFKPGE